MANTKRTVIITGLVTFILTVAGNMTSDRLQNVPVVNYISSAFAWLYQKSTSVLFFRIPLWIPILILVAWYSLNKFLKSIKADNEPDYLEYKSDVVKEWVWKWDYYKNETGQYEIRGLTPYCPKCDVLLRIDGSYSKARCPNCEKEWDTNRTYVEYGADKNGEWEDYTDTLHIIAARAKKYKKKPETS